MSTSYAAVIIGTGFSGLCVAIKLKEQGIHNFILLEKAEEIGGTWRENTYPGAECDIPSALYSYSFEPYPDWEYKWSHQPQILDYLKYCAKKYDIYQHIHFQKKLVGAAWNEDENIWLIKTEDGANYKSKTLIPAIGQLHYPSIPNFEGKDKFQGDHFHSAEWNHDVSLKGKTVGVIGNAASAVQFVPQIAKEAEKVMVFQRTPNWMLPKQDRLYKNWEKKLVRRFPILLKMYRFKLWLLTGAFYLLMKNGNNAMRKFFEWQSKRYIKNTIDNVEIRKKLVPNFPLGAKRVLFSDDYYHAINRKNVDLITDSIQSIQEKGILTQNGVNHNFDVLVYSTGFKTNPFLMGLDLKGKNGVSIHEAWKNGPINYLGICVTQFPNFFMMYGPNTNLGHNSIILMCEAQTNYIVQCVAAIEKNEWKAISIKESAMQSYYQNIQDRLQNMIWTQVEKSWYRSASGNFPNNWPGRTMEYARRTKTVKFSDFKIQK